MRCFVGPLWFFVLFVFQNDVLLIQKVDSGNHRARSEYGYGIRYSNTN